MQIFSQGPYSNLQFFSRDLRKYLTSKRKFLLYSEENLGKPKQHRTQKNKCLTIIFKDPLVNEEGFLKTFICKDYVRGQFVLQIRIFLRNLA